MKKAVIVEGQHYAGKSKTIIKYFKPLIGLTSRARNFKLDGVSGRVYSQSREEAARLRGCVRSQSLEESGRTAREVAKLIRTNANFELLVFAARPEGEEGSFLPLLKRQLRAVGYRVLVVQIIPKQPENFYAKSGRKILRHLCR